MGTYVKKSSDTQKGFETKVKKACYEAYAENQSRTGYGDVMLGMDDIDKIRRNEIKRTNNEDIWE